MPQTRIQFNNIVQNQLPAYTQTEFPLVAEFLKQYYLGQEFQGGPIDLIENIDQYTKVTEQTNVIDSVGLSTAIDAYANIIPVDMQEYPAGTNGFPSSYGLLRIDNEIITYTGTATTCFTGCVRGFCGITSYKSETDPNVLVFDTSTSQEHTGGSKVQNLSGLFLKEFLHKTKHQLLPGLEDRALHKDLNQNIFIKQAKDFYLSKGTDRSFEILFKALYKEDVEIIRPRDFLFTPSNANFKVVKDFVVESIEGEGNPIHLENSTLKQDEYKNDYFNAYAPISSVEPINTGAGTTYYKLSIDAGYNRDARVEGSIYGQFNVHSKTRVIGQVSSGSTSLDVDSTVGFPTSGELYCTYSDGTAGIVSYSSRNITQFFGCTNINGTINNATDVGINTYAYGTDSSDTTKTVKVRIGSLLEKLEWDNNTKGYGKGDIAKIKTLGIKDKTYKGKDWFFNVGSSYKINNIELIDIADFTYKINLDVEHYLKVGDLVNILQGGISLNTSTVLNINSARSFNIKGQGEITDTSALTVRRKILKGVSNTFPTVNNYSTNVQNVYKDNDKYLVATGSIPSYYAQPLNVNSQAVVFSGRFEGTEFLIKKDGDHGFYTGDAVYYSPERISQKFYNAFGREITKIVDGTELFDEGLYFVKRISDSTIKLATSRTNISNGIYVSVDTATTVTNSRIEPYDFRKKTLQSQDIFRQFVPPKNDNEEPVKTLPGFTGLLVNGVEILNYKSSDTIKYGQINNVDVTAPGRDFDIINPPVLHISDSVGTGATGYVSVEGSLKNLRVVDPGFDYEETPVVTVSGGNGSGAVVTVNMKQINHKVDFFADSASQKIGIGTTVGNAFQIGFGTYHKFRNAEKVVYYTYGQRAIAGIITNAQYYARNVGVTSITLHNTKGDAIAGINTITLTANGSGKQSIASVSKKLVVGSFNVISSGSGYENKKTTTNTSGINTATDNIIISNHGYNSGEIVRYTVEGTAAGGLTNSTDYYLTKVDNDSFKLSSVGVNTNDKQFNYRTKQYIDLTTIGVGTHIFNYQPITVTVKGKVGISSISGNTFECVTQPIFRGSIKSVHLSDNGVGYGSSEIINFDRQPLFNLIAGSQAQFTPVINDGQIVEVLVQNVGKEYISPPDLRIIGDGIGAVITPILENNTITSVKVIEGGAGYTQANTSINVIVPGNGAEFEATIKDWRINLFQRHYENFTGDDGFIADEFNEDKGLQYSHLYAPRKLRESLYGTVGAGSTISKTLYGKRDLSRVESLEVVSTDHSPIIGWAYDGNPIYGPYGYSLKTGGVVKQLTSGYKIKLKVGRPPINQFPEGFFIDDYDHDKVTDETILDENNGRFCVTPEFPNGTYAYFATITDGVSDSSGPFAGYKRPTFPYLIGNSYHSTPNDFNFSSFSNQDQYVLDKTNWLRNTVAYNLIEGKDHYEYAYIPNDLKQTIEISAVKPGLIKKIGIQTTGTQYRIGDKVRFDNRNTQGDLASAIVSKVVGKDVSSVSVATSSISSVEIFPSKKKGRYLLYTNKPHGWSNNDLIEISGLSTTSSGIGGVYRAGITTNTYTLIGFGTQPTGVGTDGVTGIVTYFNINGDFPTIDPNDILRIGTEKVKVLWTEPENNRIRVLRAQEGTAGAAHTATTVLYEDPRKVTITAGFNTTYTVKTNTEIYFQPTVTTSIGSTVISPAGVGIGTTATATATIGSSGATQGQVTGYSITDGGSSYNEAPAVTVGNPAGSTPSATVGLGTTSTTATATATVGGVGAAGTDYGRVLSTEITAAGYGYTVAPTVTFSAPTGITGLATVGLATVGTGGTTRLLASSVSIGHSGLGYITAPTITISDSFLSSGGIQTAVGIATVNSTGIVTAISFDQADPWATGTGATVGFGYSTAPTLTFSAPNGLATATGIASLTGSSVHSILGTNSGVGYSDAPTITFSAPPVGIASLAVVPGSVSIASSGLGYATAPTITVTEPTLVSGSSTVAVGIATVNAAGLVTAIGFSTTTDAWTVGTGATIGYGYLSPPTLSFSAPSYALGLTTATATATLTAESVSSITATNAGFGYTSAPTVTIADPDSAPIYETGVGLGVTIQLSINPNYPNKRTVGTPAGGFPRGRGTAGAGLTEVKVPYKTIFLPNHGFETGDEVKYYPNIGEGIVVQDDVVSEPTSGTFVGNTTSVLQSGQTLFIAKVSDNLIGIATVRVGLDTSGNNFVGIAESVRQSSTLAIIGVGTGIEHSLKTVYNPITAEVARNLVTVSTGSSHGLLNDDEIELKVNPGSISTTFTIKYNDYNRRIIVNSKDFTAAGVNTSTNEITINNHGLVTGQEIIHTATTSSIGLSDNAIYYTIRIDENTIKLAETNYNSTLEKPITIGITSASAGTINPINPPIKVYRDQPAIFDLSDSSLAFTNQSTSYPAFDFNFYVDKNLTTVFETDKETKNFNVVKVGKSGESGAKVTLTVNENIPNILYYSLDVLEESDPPLSKKTLIRRDNRVANASEIQASSSGYNGTHKVSVGATNEFTYTVAVKPEKSTYLSTESVLSYETESPTAFGGVAGFEIRDGGQNYYSAPGVTTISSLTGKGALIDVESDDIGQIKRTRIKDFGYNFPSDTTLRPSVGLPQIITIENLASIKSIGITSVGRGYTTAPELLVFDGITNKRDYDIDLEYSLGDQQVTILKNTRGLSNVQPTIIPTNASNGVGINTVGFNTTTKDVSVTLSVGFSTAGSFPFSVGDKVLVEGISVGLGTTARGYNSAEYDYKLFELTAVDPNIGGLGIVTYSVYNEFKDLDPRVTPGVYDEQNSVGRLIPEKYFPIFDVKLGVHDYLKGETVQSDAAIGVVENWDSKLGQLRVSASEDFVINEAIKGLSSETLGLASSITTYDATLATNAWCMATNGWETNSGVLNANMQRIQDSFYYQNFSYSLKSKVAYETWNDVVSALNHTIGHLKFSDMQIDSLNENSMTVGLTTSSTSYEIVNDLYGIGNLNCVHDFDLVKENSKNIGDKVISDQVIFNSRILTDYDESVGNRVLSIDDVSGSFNHRPRATQFSIANEFDITTTRARKGFHYIKDKRFTGERQLLVTTLVHDNSFGYLNQYGNGGNVYDLGSFDFSITGEKGKLLFYPRNYKVNDFSITTLAYNLDDNYLGIGTTSFGTALVESHSTEALKTNADPGTVIVGIASTYRSAKILVSINPDQSKTATGEFQFGELNIIHDGSTIDLAQYSELVTTPGDINPIGIGSTSGFGYYSTRYSGSDIQVLWHGDINNVGMGTTAVINTVTIGIAQSGSSGVGTIDLKHTKLDTRSTDITSSGSPSANVIGEYTTQVSSTEDGYDGAYFIVQLTDTTNSSYSMAEMLVMDDWDASTEIGQTLDLEYGNIGVSGIGTLGSRIVNTSSSGIATVQLTFTPSANIGIQAQVYMTALKTEDDSKSNWEFNNASVVSEYSEYEGTERDIKKAFDMQHETTPIFNRSFTGNDSDIVSVANNTITIPNHFFVTGEKVTYTHVGEGSYGAVGIAETDGFVGVGTTTLLPADAFVIKITEDKIKLAATAQKSLLTIPETLDITSVGIGTSHRFTSTNQNAKVLVSLDNIIQSPVVSTAVTTQLAVHASTTDDIVYFVGLTSFTGADLIKINNEIMRIDSVGVGSTNAIRVRRQWLGTTLAGHSTDSLVTKVKGNYNIVENVLNFTEAPYGNTPLSTTTNAPDDRDWTGIATSSSFNGRVFMRSGETNTSNETYYQNYIFDDISHDFNGTKDFFNLKTSGSNVTGIATENAIILVNDVFQGPVVNYDLEQTAGVTSVTFTGAGTSVPSDINTSQLPIGGVIVSVGSTEGMGYQPIVAAGGTALVSAAGTISGITLGYAGSGYRSGIGQTVRVAIQTSSLEGAEVVRYGTATIGSAGAITGIAITNTNVIYKPRDIQNVGYNSATGITTITTAVAHGLQNGEAIKISGIAFTCDYASAVSISTVGYTTSTGVMTVTTYSAHGLSTTGSRSQAIFSGLAFTCALDGGTYQHIYPRNRDRVFNTAVSVASTTSTTITVDVTAAKSLDRYAHTFVGPGTEAVIAGGAYGHKFIGIAQSAVVSGGDYLHTFVSSGVGSVSVTGIGTTTATGATYDASTGDLVLTIVGHGATTGNTIGIDTGGIVFTCSMDDNGSNHAYPRSTDPLAGYGTTDITSVTDNTITINVGTSATVAHAVEDAVYDAPTGILTMTIPSHGLSSNRSIRFTPMSLSFTCDMDQHGSIHSYPRTTDPVYNTAVSISATTTDTITVNVGASTQTKYNVTAANYTASTGIMTMTVGSGHSITAGDSIKFKKEGLTFTCTKDGNATRHKYPREGDPCYNGTDVLKVNSATEFEVNIGISTVLSHYTGVGTAKVQPAIIAPRAVNNSTSKTDPAEPGVNVLSIIDDYSFIVDTGISTLPHNYARGGTVEKPLKVVIDEPQSYTNIPLDYTTPTAGVGTNATIDIVVSMGGSIRDFKINNSGNGYGNNETLRVPFGGNTGIPTTSSFTNNPFELTIDEIYDDEFTGWSLGTLEALDDWDSKFDGKTTVFQLQRSGETISIRSSKGSKINVRDVILIFINDILQVPDSGYVFNGGSNVTFTEAPKVGDKSKVIFYKGSGGIDVVNKEIIETVKKGDDLTIERGSEPTYLGENVRGVSTVTSTETVQTVPYYGPGNSENESLLRPVVWCRQTEDRVINEELVGKDRELYEANINPCAYITKSVGIGSTLMYVDSIRPFFDPTNENASSTLRSTIQDSITIIDQDSKEGGIGTALVNSSGIVTGVTISDGGSGYLTAPAVSIGQTAVGLGSTAIATSLINSVGVVTGIVVSYGGTGYYEDSVPPVNIAPPTLISESDSVRDYTGDEGVIVGIQTVGAATTSIKEIVFDLHIPYDSWLRKERIVGTAITLSTLDVGDLFVVKNSWPGFANTTVNSLGADNQVIGIGTEYVDNIYYVHKASNHVTNALTSLGSTTFRRITVKYAGISTITFASTKAGFSSETYDFSSAGYGAGLGWGSGITTEYHIGDYSWGKILVSRSESNSYPAYVRNGPAGLSTGSLIRRTKPLKAKAYDGQTN